jgi:hypothetical protein
MGKVKQFITVVSIFECVPRSAELEIYVYEAVCNSNRTKINLSGRTENIILHALNKMHSESPT